MAKTPTKTAPKTTTRQQPARQAITFELVARICPNQGLAENLSRTFGLAEIDYPAIRDATEEHVALSAKALEGTLNEKAMAIHLQRVVGAFVSSAFGAGTFYGTKLSQARDVTAAAANDTRDEDRDGVAGFDSKAQRARLFAAEMGLQAFALMAAAEGAVSAYAHIIGEDWQPYEPPAAPAIGVVRRSADTEIAAFGG